ncbi:hypothetical protein M0813_18538 [Anaeramoeba flamelloides]|uniref:Uncharacterized protein n=1 Tax=Anaeramoeba flamelloides TaxID=1746091 RepID=A0ABQ8YSJ8_9EUKA|nr:hypothetical protein M0813_18538 [Anaeramoeba flamelloides]
MLLLLFCFISDEVGYQSWKWNVLIWFIGMGSTVIGSEGICVLQSALVEAGRETNIWRVLWFRPEGRGMDLLSGYSTFAMCCRPSPPNPLQGASYPTSAVY